VRRERAEYIPDISLQVSYLPLANVTLRAPEPALRRIGGEKAKQDSGFAKPRRAA
jgi:hypothetical protein